MREIPPMTMVAARLRNVTVGRERSPRSLSGKFGETSTIRHPKLLRPFGAMGGIWRIVAPD